MRFDIAFGQPEHIDCTDLHVSYVSKTVMMRTQPVGDASDADNALTNQMPYTCMPRGLCPSTAREQLAANVMIWYKLDMLY